MVLNSHKATKGSCKIFCRNTSVQLIYDSVTLKTALLSIFINKSLMSMHFPHRSYLTVHTRCALSTDTFELHSYLSYFFSCYVKYFGK